VKKVQDAGERSDRMGDCVIGALLSMKAQQMTREWEAKHPKM